MRPLLLLLFLVGCGRGTTIELTDGNGQPSGSTGLPCAGYDNFDDCEDDGACLWYGCPDCDGNYPSGQCVNDGVLPPTCPLDPCSVACEDLDEATCRAAADCHAVYSGMTDPCLCDAPGCCLLFWRCGDGGRANCSSDNLTCRAVEPNCEPPLTVGYKDQCYEGCVLETDC